MRQTLTGWGVWRRPAVLCPASLLLLLVVATDASLGAPSPSVETTPPSDQELREQAAQGMAVLMNGNPDAALVYFRRIQQEDPESPLGYLFEADALWWKVYLTIGNLVDPDVFDVTGDRRSPLEARFTQVNNLAIAKAEARLKAHQDEARNCLYEGMAYALRARAAGLHDEDLATARAGKRMRNLLLRAVQLDPQLTDAYLGLGIYNYFVDTLPTLVKMLKFLIGLPGGDREVGLKQMREVATHGELAKAEAQFYLAKDFSRTSERQYAKSLELFKQLEQQYPGNMLWKLLVGSLEIKQGNTIEGEANYRAVADRTQGPQSEVDQAIHRAAVEALRRRGK